MSSLGSINSVHKKPAKCLNSLFDYKNRRELKEVKMLRSGTMFEW